MKKIIAAAILLLSSSLLFSQAKKSAEEIKKKALAQETVLDTIDYLKNNTENSATASDKRAILYFTATLQEQLGLYTDASLSYAKAAGTGGGQAKNMPKVSTEEIVIAAVRSSLSSGDWEKAESYLASVRSSKTEKIAALVNLYTIWCQLCKVSSVKETGDSIAMLRAYSNMQSMKTVRPQVLLTLWYLTDDKNCADILKSQYPDSPETSIVKGSSQIMCVPFWYFVPRNAAANSSLPAADNTFTGEQENFSSKTESKKKEPPKGSPFEKQFQVKLESLSDSLLLNFDYRDYGTDEGCNPSDCDDESSDADAVLSAFEVAWDCHEGGDSESGADKPNEDVEDDTV